MKVASHGTWDVCHCSQAVLGLHVPYYFASLSACTEAMNDNSSTQLMQVLKQVAAVLPLFDMQSQAGLYAVTKGLHVCCCSQVLLVLPVCLPQPALLHLLGPHYSRTDTQHSSVSGVVLGSVYFLAHFWRVYCAQAPNTWLVDLVSMKQVQQLHAVYCAVYNSHPNTAFIVPACPGCKSKHTSARFACSCLS